MTPACLAEVTLKFTDPDQTRFALSAASQLGPFKRPRLGEGPRGRGGAATDGAALRKRKKKPWVEWEEGSRNVVETGGRVVKQKDRGELKRIHPPDEDVNK